VSGELNRGTMEMLLAQPISRSQVILSQAMVVVWGLVLLAAATWVGTFVGIHTSRAKIERQPSLNMPLGYNVPLPFLKAKIEKVPMRSQVDPRQFIPAAVNLFCLGFCFAGGASLLSACDRYRWRTVGLSISFLVVQTVCKLLGVAAKDWHWLKNLSVFSAY